MEPTVEITSLKLISNRDFKKDKYRNGICSEQMHRTKTDDGTIAPWYREYHPDEFKLKIESNGLDFRDILSIDLSGLEVTEELMELICKYCPQIECLFIYKTKWHLRAFDLLREEMGPKLKHLMVDNSIKTINCGKALDFHFKDLFEKCLDLEEFKIILYENESFDTNSLESLDERKVIMAFVKIVVFSKSVVFWKSVVKKLPKTIQYLRFVSKQNKFTVIPVIEELDLPYLRALNLNIRNYELEKYNITIDTYGYFKALNRFENIESLTLRVFGLSDEWIQWLSGATFAQKITRLRLEEAELNGEHLYSLFTRYSNLESLHLIGTVFSDEESVYRITAQIIGLEKLDELMIHYNREETKYLEKENRVPPHPNRMLSSDSDSTDSENIYFKYSTLFSLIQECHLKYIELLSIPGLNPEEQDLIEDIESYCRDHDIEIYIDY